MSTFTIFGVTTDGGIDSGPAAAYATAAAGSGTLATRTTSLGVGQDADAVPNFNCHESVIAFDCSSVTGTVTSAVLSLVPLALQVGIGFVVEARTKDWGATLDTGDFVAATGLGALTLCASIGTGALTAINTRFDFTDTAMAAAVVVGGTTKLLLCSDRHRTQVAPGTNTLERAFFYKGGDAGGATTQPRLVITTAGTSWGAQMSHTLNRIVQTF